jgi:hypothetical protein
MSIQEAWEAAKASLNTRRKQKQMTLRPTKEIKKDDRADQQNKMNTMQHV